MPGIDFRGGKPLNYALGRGRLLIQGDAAYFVAGVEQAPSALGYRDVGNVTAFTVSQESETKEHRSFLTGLANTDLELAVSNKMTLAFQCDEISATNLARFLSGDAIGTDVGLPLANAAAIVSTTFGGVENYYQDLTGTEPFFDVWYAITLGFPALGEVRAIDFESQASQAIAVHKNPTNRTTGGTLLAEGTHYELDRKMGLIRFKLGALALGDSFRVGWAAPTVAKSVTSGIDDSLFAIRPLTGSGKTVRMMFLAENPNDSNMPSAVEFWSVKLRPEGEAAFIGDDWMTLGFTGAVQSVSSYPADASPYGRILGRKSFST